MNAPAKLTRDYVAEVERLSTATLKYLYALAASDGAYTRKVREAERDWLEAVVAHVDDGDCLAALEIVREELGEAEPVEPRWAVPGFGARHPDHPEFGG